MNRRDKLKNIEEANKKLLKEDISGPPRFKEGGIVTNNYNRIEVLEQWIVRLYNEIEELKRNQEYL